MASLVKTKNHVVHSIRDEQGNRDINYFQNTLQDVLIDEDYDETIRGHITYYAVCKTAADEAAKEITVVDGTTDVLVQGTHLSVTFQNGNTAKAPVTLSVNGKPSYTMEGVMESNITAGQTMILIYTGTSFIIGGASGVPVEKEERVGQEPDETRYPVFVDKVSGNAEFKMDPEFKIGKDGLKTKVSESTVEFTEELDSANTDYRETYKIQTKDTLSTIVRKIRKIFGGLGSLAFRSSIGTAELDQSMGDHIKYIVHKNGAINGVPVNDLYNGTDYSGTAGLKALDAKVGATLQNSITDLNSKITAFENTKATIVGSNLGSALGMTSTIKWSDLVTKITGVTTKTSGSTAQSTANKWGINTTNGAWLYIPTNAYYTTSHWLNIPWNTIKGSFGDAVVGNVIKGKTFTSTNGLKITGTLEFTGNADTGHVLKDKTFYKNSTTKLTGTMSNNGSLDWKPANGTTKSVTAGYYSGGTLDSRDAYNNGYTAGAASVTPGTDLSAIAGSLLYGTRYDAGHGNVGEKTVRYTASGTITVMAVSIHCSNNANRTDGMNMSTTGTLLKEFSQHIPTLEESDMGPKAMYMIVSLTAGQYVQCVYSGNGTMTSDNMFLVFNFT